MRLTIEQFGIVQRSAMRLDDRRDEFFSMVTARLRAIGGERFDDSEIIAAADAAIVELAG